MATISVSACVLKAENLLDEAFFIDYRRGQQRQFSQREHSLFPMAFRGMLSTILSSCGTL